MKSNDLTYEEKYGLPVVLIVRTIKAEYHDCGSHRIELLVSMDISDIRELYASLGKIKGVTDEVS